MEISAASNISTEDLSRDQGALTGQLPNAWETHEDGPTGLWMHDWSQPARLREEDRPTQWPEWSDPLDFREVPVAEAVARINAAGYFVLTCNGDIYKRNADGGVAAQRPSGFNTVFACRNARDSDGNLRPAGVAWRHHPERCEYKEIGYWPNNYNQPPKSYNLWQGWGVEPRQGNCSIIHDHVLHVIAGGNNDKANYIFDWCAHMIQRPWEKPGVALVLKGRKGTGKSVLTEILARVVGQKNTLITDDGNQLFAKFNWHLADKLLIGAEEAFFAGQRRLSDRLKHLLTGTAIEIEQKFGHRISMKSMHRMIMTSNHGNVIEMTEDERQFFVYEVSDQHQGDDSYFAPLWRAANGEDEATLAAFMYELKTRDITNWKAERGARNAAALHFKREELVSLLKGRAIRLAGGTAPASRRRPSPGQIWQKPAADKLPRSCLKKLQLR